MQILLIPKIEKCLMKNQMKMKFPTKKKKSLNNKYCTSSVICKARIDNEKTNYNIVEPQGKCKDRIIHHKTVIQK